MMSRNIDYVVPMVFDNDSAWRDDYLTLHRVYNPNAYYTLLYRSWGLEHLHILLVRKYMPWIRKIHVLLARESQRQEWMTEDLVHVVYHKDFIPQEYLPTFNACTIEMFLHKIPNLSEQFIYSNDDMIITNPLSKEDFFKNGVPCQLYYEQPYSENPNVFEAFCMKGLNMIAADFGKHYSDTWLYGGHSLSALLKSTCEKVWDNHQHEILDSISPERKEKNLNQYIYSYYQHLSGNYIKHTPQRMLLSSSIPLERILMFLQKKDIQVACINDNSKNNDFDKYTTAIKSCLENKLNQ